jgi:hypothetical protein
MADSRALEYKRKLDELARLAKEPTVEAQRAIERLLSDMSREILGDIARQIRPATAQQRLKELKTAVDRAADDFQRAASSQVTAIERKTYLASADSVDAASPPVPAGIAVHAVIDTRALALAQGYTADLISNLSREASARINLAIQRAYMGAVGSVTLINQVGSALEDGKFTGIFGPVGDKAVSIATNEVMRVHSLASQSRIEDLATRHPELGKQWMHIPAALIPARYASACRRPGAKGHEPFDVAARAVDVSSRSVGISREHDQLPLLQRPHLPPESLKPTDQERSLLQKLGLSITLANKTKRDVRIHPENNLSSAIPARSVAGAARGVARRSLPLTRRPSRPSPTRLRALIAKGSQCPLLLFPPLRRILPDAIQEKWTAAYKKGFSKPPRDHPENESAQRGIATKEANRLLAVPPPQSAKDIDALEDWQVLTRGVKDGKAFAVTMTAGSTASRLRKPRRRARTRNRLTKRIRGRE